MSGKGIKGRMVVSWQGGKGGRSVKWQGERFLILFKVGGHRVSPRFHLLFLMLINRTKLQDEFKFILHDQRDRRTLLRSYTSC